MKHRCARCGAETKRPPSKTGNNVYCSVECKVSSQIIGKKEYVHERKKQKVISTLTPPLEMERPPIPQYAKRKKPKLFHLSERMLKTIPDRRSRTDLVGPDEPDNITCEPDNATHEFTQAPRQEFRPFSLTRLRDYFAVHVLEGLVGGGFFELAKRFDGKWIAKECAETAYDFADAMIRERFKRQPRNILAAGVAGNVPDSIAPAVLNDDKEELVLELP